ncbi:MAG: UDP-N-acetylmuramate dehydrogenase [Simkaniaceae bacterium]|nr:UDP-N-acetylmuramate dehydrogenase [Simkaniaceae bacterium]
MRPNILRDRPLAPHTSFRIGGPATYFAHVRSIEEMVVAYRFALENTVPFVVIGKGSNVLFDDRGFSGFIALNAIDFCHINGGSVEVGAGHAFPKLSAKLSRVGLSGLEFGVGIPGSIGGAIFMNAGADGGDTATCLQSVSHIDEGGELRTTDVTRSAFGYRRSPFQKTGAPIVSAVFALRSLRRTDCKRGDIMKRRKATQPYALPSAGCIFRNPEGGHGAGYLIDRCGLKGKRVGGAIVSPVHANFIVNTGGARSRDVLELIETIEACVWEKAGIALEREVRIF